jgi:hypothetical protein
MAAKLILALVVVGSAASDDAAPKLLIRKGPADGRRLQNNFNSEWNCNIFTSETVDLDACDRNGGITLTYDPLVVSCDGTVVPDAVANNFKFMAQGDDCREGMVPADLEACQVLDVAWPFLNSQAPYGEDDQCGGAPQNGNTAIAIFDSTSCVYAPSGNHMPCVRNTANGLVHWGLNSDGTGTCATDNCGNDIDSAEAAGGCGFYQGVCMHPRSTPNPTAHPTAHPTAQPTADPTAQPVASPTFYPTTDPYGPLRSATDELKEVVDAASDYAEAKARVKAVKRLTKALPACATGKDTIRKNTNRLLRRIRKQKPWNDIGGRLRHLMDLQRSWLKPCV